MDHKFCPHLEKYGRNFRVAEEAYHMCVELMDEAMAGKADHALLDQLATALNAWEKHTRNLRSTFVSLKEKGHVLLPREGQNTSPVCGHCGFVVPRFEFPDFQIREDGAVVFRGQVLNQPEPVAEAVS